MAEQTEGTKRRNQVSSQPRGLLLRTGIAPVLVVMYPTDSSGPALESAGAPGEVMAKAGSEGLLQDGQRRIEMS